jgi:hypothetical protein
VRARQIARVGCSRGSIPCARNFRLAARTAFDARPRPGARPHVGGEHARARCGGEARERERGEQRAEIGEPPALAERAQIDRDQPARRVDEQAPGKGAAEHEAGLVKAREPRPEQEGQGAHAVGLASQRPIEPLASGGQRVGVHDGAGARAHRGSSEHREPGALELRPRLELALRFLRQRKGTHQGRMRARHQHALHAIAIDQVARRVIGQLWIPKQLRHGGAGPVYLAGVSRSSHNPPSRFVERNR